MPKNTEEYDYSYSDGGTKSCVNECVWPDVYTPFDASKQAERKAPPGYKKMKDLCKEQEIDEGTVEKSKMYLKKTGYKAEWLEINYKRTRTLKM